MKRTIFLTATLASAVGLFGLGATAQQKGVQVEAKDNMSLAKLATMLEGQGYKVLEIELERGRYDVDMLDGNGMKVEAYLDPVTGEALPYRDDDRYEDDRYDTGSHGFERDDD